MAKFTSKNWLSTGETGANDNNSVLSKENMNDLENRIEKADNELEKEIKNINLLDVPETTIQENSNLNNYTSPGIYAILSASIAQTISNIPIATAGKLIVQNLNFAQGYRQYYLTNRTDCKTYVRYGSYGNWNPWVETTFRTLEVPMVDIGETANLNNYTTIGTYRCAGSSIATTLINSPVNNGAFKLIVEKINMEERIRQTIYANNQNCDTYVRYYNGTWGSWHKINMTTV